MEQSKLQKIAGAIVPVLIIGWIFGYKFYHNNQVKQINKFIDSYNAYVTSQSILATSLPTIIDEETGKVKSATQMDATLEKVKKLKNSDCNYLTKEEVKTNCINIFTKTENYLNEIKEKGLSEELANNLEKLGDENENFEKDLTEKVWIKFR